MLEPETAAEQRALKLSILLLQDALEWKQMPSGLPLTPDMLASLPDALRELRAALERGSI